MRKRRVGGGAVAGGWVLGKNTGGARPEDVEIERDERCFVNATTTSGTEGLQSVRHITG